MWSAVALLLSYLLGSLSGSLILGRVIGVDIRQSGSGNAGGTNALRIRGWKFALVVVVIDVGKGVLAALVPGWFGVDGSSLPWLEVGCVLVAAAGHTWPVFFGFRGGKGGAVLVGGLAVIWPWALVVVLAVWLLVLLVSGYVGLATVLATAALVPLAALDGAGASPGARWAFAVLAALFIGYTHRGNLQRLRAGREYRFEQARLLARRRWRRKE